MVALVIDNKLYTANSGDSKAVLLRHDPEQNSFENINVTTTYNANKKSEQARLKEAFKNEGDVVVCKRNDPKACYVKGGLMPTRAIGDLRLKKRDFNFHQFDVNHGYRNSIPGFTGPYITSEPQVQVH